MRLISCKSWELVADLDYLIFIWLEEKTNITVVYDRDVLIFGGLLWGEVEMCVDPRLENVSYPSYLELFSSTQLP